MAFFDTGRVMVESSVEEINKLMKDFFNLPKIGF